MALAVLIHFGVCDVAGADHGLQRQSHAELESQCEGCHFVGIVQFRCAVLELLEGFLLRLRQRLHQVILITRYQMQQMGVGAAFDDVPIARSDIAIV